MGFRFRRTLSLGPLLRLNFSKSGTSLSAGVRGARMTFGRNGIRTTVGLPGSGLSYTHLERSGRRTPRPRWLRLALWIVLVSAVLWLVAS